MGRMSNIPAVFCQSGVSVNVWVKAPLFWVQRPVYVRNMAESKAPTGWRAVLQQILNKCAGLQQKKRPSKGSAV